MVQRRRYAHCFLIYHPLGFNFVLESAIKSYKFHVKGTSFTFVTTYVFYLLSKSPCIYFVNFASDLFHLVLY